MSFLFVLIVVFLFLFALLFFTKRRFGVIGLALIAGAYISNLWATDLTRVMLEVGMTLTQPPLGSVVAASLILAPAFVLLLSGPVYVSVLRRVVGGLLFSTLAVTLLLDHFSAAFIIEDVGKNIYDFLVTYRTIIVTVCITFALFDVLSTKTPKPAQKH